MSHTQVSIMVFLRLLPLPQGQFLALGLTRVTCPWYWHPWSGMGPWSRAVVSCSEQSQQGWLPMKPPGVGAACGAVHAVPVPMLTQAGGAVFTYSAASQETCEQHHGLCYPHAFCTDYATGFCCHCQTKFYGNGRHCLPEGESPRGRLWRWVWPPSLPEADPALAPPQARHIGSMAKSAGTCWWGGRRCISPTWTCTLTWWATMAEPTLPSAGSRSWQPVP